MQEASSSIELSHSLPFQTKQSTGKAIKCVKKSLPKLPRKKKSVLPKMIEDAGLEGKGYSVKKKSSSKGQSSEECELVKNFHLDNEISWQAPVMKDRVIFREIVDGKKAKETKEIRYMLMSSKEVYEHFKNEFPEVLLELLKFCSLRRFHVKLLDQIHHNVCVCKYHENILLILIVLEKYNFDSFVDQVTFDQSNKDHIYRNCDKCKDLLDMLKPLFDVGETLTTYEQWQSEKKHAEKLTISGTVHDIFEDLKINLTDFLEHRYVKKKQQAHFGELIETCDSRSIVLQVGFF